jgi:hypothetical protein
MPTVCTSVVWVSELALNPGSYLGGSFNLIIAFLRKSETQFLKWVWASNYPMHNRV